MKKKLKYMTILCAAVACLFSSCNKSSQQQMPSANFETMKVSTKDVTMTTKYAATIRGRQDIDILPQVSVTLTKLCVTEGQVVKTGQTLFIIDQVPYQAALNTALASL
jgi:membrane fusion protein (multidrug efflux system)